MPCVFKLETSYWKACTRSARDMCTWDIWHHKVYIYNSGHMYALLETNAVLPAGLSKNKTREKNAPFWEKKHNFSKKKALFDIISFLKRVFCLPFLHTKICPFNMFKTINYLFLFFNISKTYFTKQQTPLMIIVSHTFKEMIFFIRIDQEV